MFHLNYPSVKHGKLSPKWSLKWENHQPNLEIVDDFPISMTISMTISYILITGGEEKKKKWILRPFSPGFLGDFYWSLWPAIFADAILKPWPKKSRWGFRKTYNL